MVSTTNDGDLHTPVLAMSVDALMIKAATLALVSGDPDRIALAEMVLRQGIEIGVKTVKGMVGQLESEVTQSDEMLTKIRAAPEQSRLAQLRAKIEQTRAEATEILVNLRAALDLVPMLLGKSGDPADSQAGGDQS